jgi:hypothetical protein
LEQHTGEVAQAILREACGDEERICELPQSRSVEFCSSDFPNHAANLTMAEQGGTPGVRKSLNGPPAFVIKEQ